jgi:hypothetical protein
VVGGLACGVVWLGCGGCGTKVGRLLSHSANTSTRHRAAWEALKAWRADPHPHNPAPGHIPFTSPFPGRLLRALSHRLIDTSVAEIAR